MDQRFNHSRKKENPTISKGKYLDIKEKLKKETKEKYDELKYIKC